MPSGDSTRPSRPDQPLRLRMPLLTLVQKELMLSLLIRDPVLMRYAASEISDRHFHPINEQYLQLAWSVAKAYYLEHSELIPRRVFYTELKSRLNTDEIDITHSQLRSLDAFLKSTFSLSDEQVRQNVPAVQGYLKRFLTELLQEQVQSTISSGGAIDDLPQILDDLAGEARRHGAAGLTGAPLPFTDGAGEEPGLSAEMTGISFLDRYMRGGQAAEEVYGFCAPFGTCKTVVACQLAGFRALWEQQQAAEEKRRPKTVYLAVYEEPAASIRARLISYVGMIDKETVERNDVSQMSSCELENYKRYEQQQWGRSIAAGERPPGELERYLDARELLNINLRHLDFSGGTPLYASLAGELVAGLRMAIDNDQRYNGNPGVSMVAVDYAGAAVDRHIEAHNLSPKDVLRYLVGSFPTRLRATIAAPLHCPVWVFHQVSTKANEAAPGRAPGITDTAEAKDFNKTTTFGFAVGQKNNDSLAVIASTKQRRAEKTANCVLWINGRFARVEEATNFTIQNDRIMPKDYAAITEGSGERRQTGANPLGMQGAFD